MELYRVSGVMVYEFYEYNQQRYSIYNTKKGGRLLVGGHEVMK
jgi:hypothetical protein